MAHDLSRLKLSDVFAAVLEEQVALPMFFQIVYLSIVNFSIGVLYLPLLDNIVLLPFASDNFPRRKDQRAFSVELVAQAVADVLIAMKELEVSFDFDAILVDSFEDDAVAVVNLGLSVYLIVFPVGVYFVAVSVALG